MLSNESTCVYTINPEQLAVKVRARPFSLLSYGLQGRANAWSISCPGSMPLYPSSNSSFNWTLQLAQFIDRTPQLKTHCDEAWVVFSDTGATVSLSRTLDNWNFELGISCLQIDWKLSSLAQVCDSRFPQGSHFRSKVSLHPREKIPAHRWEDGIENG